MNRHVIGRSLARGRYCEMVEARGAYLLTVRGPRVKDGEEPVPGYRHFPGFRGLVHVENVFQGAPAVLAHLSWIADRARVLVACLIALLEPPGLQTPLALATRRPPMSLVTVSEREASKMGSVNEFEGGSLFGAHRGLLNLPGGDGDAVSFGEKRAAVIQESASQQRFPRCLMTRMTRAKYNIGTRPASARVQRQPERDRGHAGGLPGTRRRPEISTRLPRRVEAR